MANGRMRVSVFFRSSSANEKSRVSALVQKSVRTIVTKTYDHFHDPTCTDPDIQTLRHLHIQMDTAVAAAYGWHDLPLNHNFHDTKQGLRFTISEAARREVLDRLLALNHHRYAEEVAQGLHDKKKAKGKSKAKGKAKPRDVNEPQAGNYTVQGSLFGDSSTQGELF